MIDLPIFPILKANATVTDLLESNGILRAYSFGLAPENPQPPYVTWQIVGGDPYNNLDVAPSCDRVDVQIDVYATDDDVVSDVAKAVRNAIETECYVTRYGNQDRDPVTGMPHYSFDVSWHVNR